MSEKQQEDQFRQQFEIQQMATYGFGGMKNQYVIRAKIVDNDDNKVNFSDLLLGMNSRKMVRANDSIKTTIKTINGRSIDEFQSLDSVNAEMGGAFFANKPVQLVVIRSYPKPTAKEDYIEQLRHERR